MQRIIYENNEGGVSIIVPTGKIEDCIKDVPKGKTYKIVNTSDIPSDRTFRNAWKDDNGITVDMPKAKLISHEKRRAKRAEEFKPLDIEATIPSMAVAAESKRQVIRDKHAAIQNDIDLAQTAAGLKAIIELL